MTIPPSIVNTCKTTMHRLSAKSIKVKKEHHKTVTTTIKQRNRRCKAKVFVLVVLQRSLNPPYEKADDLPSKQMLRPSPRKECKYETFSKRGQWYSLEIRQDLVLELSNFSQFGP